MSTLYTLTIADGVFTFTPQAEPMQHLLPVPWVGQNTTRTDDDYSNSDCGAACVAMWLDYQGQMVSVDQVSIATGKPRGYAYTLPSDLITAAAKFGLNLRRVVGLGQLSIRREIDKQHPVIMLVHYGSLPQRFDANFKAGHWIIITGYTETQVVYNDPYWPDALRGQSIVMTWADFDRVVSDCALDGNTPQQGLVTA